MKKQILITKLVLLISWSAHAGGVSEPTHCDHLPAEVVATTPVNIYLKDGSTKMTVGEASVLSQLIVCPSGNIENIDVRVKLIDEIKPYNLKIKGTIFNLKTSISIDFRLKELVNTSEYLQTHWAVATNIQQIGHGPMMVNYKMNTPHFLFWQQGQANQQGIVSAQSNPQLTPERPLMCALESAYFNMILEPNADNGLEENLAFSALFSTSMKLCP